MVEPVERMAAYLFFGLDRSLWFGMPRSGFDSQNGAGSAEYNQRRLDSLDLIRTDRRA